MKAVQYMSKNEISCQDKLPILKDILSTYSSFYDSNKIIIAFWKYVLDKYLELDWLSNYDAFLITFKPFTLLNCFNYSN